MREPIGGKRNCVLLHSQNNIITRISLTDPLKLQSFHSHRFIYSSSVVHKPIVVASSETSFGVWVLSRRKFPSKSPSHSSSLSKRTRRFPSGHLWPTETQPFLPKSSHSVRDRDWNPRSRLRRRPAVTCIVFVKQFTALNRLTSCRPKVFWLGFGLQVGLFSKRPKPIGRSIWNPNPVHIDVDGGSVIEVCYLRVFGAALPPPSPNTSHPVAIEGDEGATTV